MFVFVSCSTFTTLSDFCKILRKVKCVSLGVVHCFFNPTFINILIAILGCVGFLLRENASVASARFSVHESAVAASESVATVQTGMSSGLLLLWKRSVSLAMILNRIYMDKYDELQDRTSLPSSRAALAF